jgi:hypothetical protein
MTERGIRAIWFFDALAPKPMFAEAGFDAGG